MRGMTDALIMWTVYQQPKDYPQGFIARRWEVTAEARATGDTLTGRTLHEVRAKLPPGLYRLGREQGDDPVIVETWL